MNEIDLDRAEREQVRWRILVALQAGQPFPVNEMLILRVLQDDGSQTTPAELRNQLRYLEVRELITIAGKGTPTWSADLTRTGIDVVEHTIPCEAGIARPQKWY